MREVNLRMMEAIASRYSCRAYADRPLPEEIYRELEGLVGELNAESGLHFQLYGPREGGRSAIEMSASMFAGPVYCYAALAAPADPLSGEKTGYYGEQLVLSATSMGLGTCWVASTYHQKTTRAALAAGEKLWDVVPIGWPAEKTPLKQKTIRAALRAKSRKPAQMTDTDSPWKELPEWFRAGVEAAEKGPSAVNGQPVVFHWLGGRVTAGLRSTEHDVVYNDLGIAKLHFAIAAACKGVSGRWNFGVDAAFVY